MQGPAVSLQSYPWLFTLLLGCYCGQPRGHIRSEQSRPGQHEGNLGYKLWFTRLHELVCCHLPQQATMDSYLM